MNGTKTKAAVLVELHKHLEIEELEVPVLGVGQVLVEVRKTALCGRQIAEISGAKGPDKYLPHLLGHEGGGIVIDAGPGVKKVTPGQPVVLHWRKGAGIEAAPPRYRRQNGGFVGAGPVATFTEFAVVSENRITPITDEIDHEIAALLGCSVTTGLGLINNEAKLKIGQSIAVLGVGGVGLNVIQGAALVSAHPIIAIDIKAEKLNRALEYGADYVLDNRKLPIETDIYAMTGGRGVDVFVETTGRPDLINLAYHLTAPGGKTIMVGQPGHGQHLGLTNQSDNFTGKTLIDSEGGQTNPDIDIPRYIELYRNRKLKLDSLITHEFNLEGINKAIAKVIDGEAGKVIISL